MKIFVQKNNFDWQVVFIRIPKFFLTLNFLVFFRFEPKYIVILIGTGNKYMFKIVNYLNLEIPLHNASHIVWGTKEYTNNDKMTM